MEPCPAHAPRVVDVWDLDVVAGKTYFATVAAPKSGWSGYVNEKFAPSSKHWARLTPAREPR